MVKKVFIFIKFLILANLLLANFNLEANAAQGPNVNVENTITYNCSIKILKVFEIATHAEVTIVATVPEWVDPNEHFNINVNSISILFPENTVYVLKHTFLIDQVYGSVDSFPIIADNLHESVDIGNSLFFETTPVPAYGDLVLTIDDSIHVGPFLAGSAGEDHLSLGNIAFKLQNDSHWYQTFPLEVNCELYSSAPYFNVFASILIRD